MEKTSAKTFIKIGRHKKSINFGFLEHTKFGKKIILERSPYRHEILTFQLEKEKRFRFDHISIDYCPRFLTFPKLSMISYAQLWLLLFFQISLFIYFNLALFGPLIN